MPKSSHYQYPSLSYIFVKVLLSKYEQFPNFLTLSRLRNYLFGKWFAGVGTRAIAVFCLVGLTGEVGWTQTSQNIELEVVVVQRFGRQPTDQLILQATEGDRR